MSQAQVQITPDGAILFDAGVIAQADFDPAWFEPVYWRARGQAQTASAGRGGASYIDAPFGRSVLRHYRRGGMIARVMGDRYLWTGGERTRGFAEFRLLSILRERLACRCRSRRVIAATGALSRGPITRRIEAATRWRIAGAGRM